MYAAPSSFTDPHPVPSLAFAVALAFAFAVAVAFALAFAFVVAVPYSLFPVPLSFARSHARHKYQLATERNGAHLRPRRNSTSGLGKSAASTGLVFGSFRNVNA